MAVSDDTQSLRDQVLADLAAAHDYYTDTKIAWRLVHKVIAAGHTVNIRNIDHRHSYQPGGPLPDKDAITGLVVRKELNEVMYERPTELFPMSQSLLSRRHHSAHGILQTRTAGTGAIQRILPATMDSPYAKATLG